MAARGGHEGGEGGHVCWRDAGATLGTARGRCDSHRPDRATAPSTAVAAAPSLQLSSVIHTNPFTGTSTRLHDGEGSAYVPSDDSLWLADDNGSEVVEVNRPRVRSRR